MLDYQALLQHQVTAQCPDGRRPRSVADIQHCYPSNMLRTLPPNCAANDITDWRTVQRCLTGRFQSHNTKENGVTSTTGTTTTTTTIRHVHIIGERHSGTKFLTATLQACFPRHSTRTTFRVHRDFIRSKHFFQPISNFVVLPLSSHTKEKVSAAGAAAGGATAAGATFDQQQQHPLAESVVIVVVRHPVDWIAAMHAKPYHSPYHVAEFGNNGIVPLAWHDFVTRPWTLPNATTTAWDTVPSSATDTVDKDIINNNMAWCQDGFRYNEVVPCFYNETSGKVPTRFVRGFAPVYELQRDGSGRPFPSILDLRSEKLVNFALEIPLLMKDLSGFMIVRYEDLLRNGTHFVVEQLREILNLPPPAVAHCRPTPPQPDRLHARPVPLDFQAYVESHVDANVERLLGYLW
jgi:hypothetical protein